MPHFTGMLFILPEHVKMTNNSHELKNGNKLQLGELLVEVRTNS